MSSLSMIVPELVHLADTLKSIINVDITVVDQTLLRLVGTGRLMSQIGKRAPLNSAFGKCMNSGEQMFVENPKQSHLCSDCENRESCTEMVELCIPLKYDNRTLGVLGMCAFSPDAELNILSNRESMIALEYQLGQFVSTMLREREFESIMECHSSETMTLINSMEEGILILNQDHQIFAANQSVAHILNFKSPPEELTPYPRVQDLFSTQTYAKLEQQNFNGRIGPIALGGQEYLINANPIEVKGRRTGIILRVSNFSKMRESVLKADKAKNMMTFADILGECELMQTIKRQASQIADCDVSVLLTGETGTGKEVFAQAIHEASLRKDNIFLPINCGAIPENLIESELFGYEKGAFTGASPSGHQGKFEICKKGTLFLDEIGDLPLPMQVKLLRALETKEITRIGSHTSIRANPRIISATSLNLEEMIKKHVFREDLFYRLNIVTIEIPPLRNRGYDIIILARHFLRHFCTTYGKQIEGFTDLCEKLLMKYPFPGNIRELRNLVEYAVIFEQSDLVGADMIRCKLQMGSPPGRQTLTELTRQYERQVIEQCVLDFGNTLEGKRLAAEELGISIATLYRKLGEPQGRR